MVRASIGTEIVSLLHRDSFSVTLRHSRVCLGHETCFLLWVHSPRDSQHDNENALVVQLSKHLQLHSAHGPEATLPHLVLDTQSLYFSVPPSELGPHPLCDPLCTLHILCLRENSGVSVKTLLRPSEGSGPIFTSLQRHRFPKPTYFLVISSVGNIFFPNFLPPDKNLFCRRPDGELSRYQVVGKIDLPVCLPETY